MKRNTALAIYPISGRPESMAISNEITSKLQIKLDNYIQGLIPADNIGALYISDPKTRNIILGNYKKLDKKLVISNVNIEMLKKLIKPMKQLQDIFKDNHTTLDASNLNERLITEGSINIDENMSTIIFILSVIAFRDKSKITKIIFDSNNLNDEECMNHIGSYFENLKTVSIKDNPIRKAVFKSKKIKCDNEDQTDATDQDDSDEPKKKALNIQNFGFLDGGNNNDDSDDEDKKKKNKIIYLDKVFYQEKKYPPPPTLPSIDKRFETVLDHSDQDQHFQEMMEKLFDPTYSNKDEFYSPTAVFSYTISELIQSTNLPLYNFFKANDCNLINISNVNHKNLGTNFFFERPDIFPDGISSKFGINLMPTVAIGSELYAVVVNAVLNVTYNFANDDLQNDVCTIHTFTIASNGEYSQILSHQIFFYTVIQDDDNQAE